MTPTRIVMRAGKPPHAAMSVENALAYGNAGTFATNVGNALYATAVYRHLKTPRTQVLTDGMTMQQPGVTDEDCARLNEEADAVVLPLANAFRESFLHHLDNLSEMIERLTIPVIVIGVGSQLTLGDGVDTANDAVNDSARRFVAAVLDRSESIGVRGEVTAAYLRDLGFSDDRIDVIGCPSMFDLDHARRIDKPQTLDADAPMAISLTPGVPLCPELFRHNFERYPGLIYVGQEISELRLLVWGEPVENCPDGFPMRVDHPAYTSGRMRMCVDLSTWSALMAQQRFAFGTRLHGVVAGLHAGTPSMLLAHDSRTLELAEYHRIPFLRTDDAPPLDARELFDRLDVSDYNAAADDRLARYARFLERNGLEHTLDPANRDHEYDQSLANAAFPPPIAPITVSDPTQAISRLRWLWEYPGTDRRRAARFYNPEFPANSGVPKIRPLATMVFAHERRGERQGARIAELRRQVRELERQVDRLERITQTLVSRTLRSRVKRLLQRFGLFKA